MSAIPYMPLYVADYLADTSHLSAVENGAYVLLIMNYWQRGKSLPCGDDQLARVCRLSTKEWRVIKPVIQEFFDEQDGFWMHGRVETELAKVRGKSAKASNAGKASAQRNGNGRSTDVEQTFNHTDTDTDTDKKERSLADQAMAVSIWNEMATTSGLSAIQRLTEPRAKSLKARLIECGGIEGWRIAIVKVRDSPFLRGENDKGWKADFDFVLQAKSFTKLMEGSYDARQSGNHQTKQPRSFVAEALGFDQPAGDES